MPGLALVPLFAVPSHFGEVFNFGSAYQVEEARRISPRAFSAQIVSSSLDV
jgi:hypothetical protein